MASPEQNYPRGSEWRIWDLHVHTPASFHWNGGQRFSAMNPAQKKDAIDQLIKIMNDSPPAVFALMDYWTFDGWFALKKRLKDEGAPVLKKKVFPGIELRLRSPTNYRLNAHVIFSDDITDQQLQDFRTGLTVELVERPLSDESLIELVRKHVGADLLQKAGFTKSEVDKEDGVALQAGSIIAEIQPDSYKNAIAKVPEGKAIGFMPWDTSDGLAEADWQTHYAFVIGLMKISPIFETRKDDLWAAFVGKETSGNKTWLPAFQNALQHVPRLAVSGSDAHQFADYGVFPSGKATWIKADPTFRGLLQAIKEPARRSYIGQLPPKIKEVEDNKTYFIESIAIHKKSGSSLADQWFDGCMIPLNPDLIAIIGNKGSGKSALADVIALLGDSRSSKHFSFLSPRRFCQQPSILAKNFEAEITWKDGTKLGRTLSDSVSPQSPELVRYIPQLYFEDLCNSHVSGKSDAFEKELRFVIFAHTNDAVRQGALDFDQLLHDQEQALREALVEFRKELHVLNQDIERIEGEMAPEQRRTIQELLLLKEKELQEHDKVKPAIVAPPTETQSPEQKAASERLTQIAQKLQGLTQEELTLNTAVSEDFAKLRAAAELKERLKLFKRQVKQLQEETSSSFALLGLKPEDVINIHIIENPIELVETALGQNCVKLNEKIQAIAPTRQTLITEQETLKAKLDAPQQAYQQHLAVAETWQEKRDVLVGNPQTAESLNGLKARLSRHDSLPDELLQIKKLRDKVAKEILAELLKQRQIRELLFKPVQDVINANSLIREDYKLQFKAALSMSTTVFSERLFSMIKQNFGSFKGETESHNVIQSMVEMHDVNSADGALKLVSELIKEITINVHGEPNGIGIAYAMRVNRKSSELYDYLYGLEFLDPRYTLLFQDTQIEHLSPGQRGALLLIFYLLVDTGHNPIILDQPEENLDNETIVSLLVPVLTEAKKRRQIIMVTHNPNLAVVSDAEQIIYSSFTRKNKCQILYAPGAIESSNLNKHVVNVLEGTKFAFDNRGQKYH